MARVVVTSNAPDWRGVAAPVEIKVWPPKIGAEFLMERTGQANESDAASSLSETLGGLPLAHEQAAAYCERTGMSLAEYRKRFESAPSTFLDNAQDASRQYRDGLTVSKTFCLAMDEATKLHPAAESLIMYCIARA
jgi:hypothetical protein